MGYITKLISVVSIPGFESKIYKVFFPEIHDTWRIVLGNRFIFVSTC